MGFQDILVPLDFHEASLRALRLAVGLAPGRVTLLAVEGAAMNLPAGVHLGAASEKVFATLAQEIEAQLQASLERLIATELPAGLAARTCLRRGLPAAEILAQLEAGAHDLVVMGTHGRTGLSHLLLGSVAERVLRQSPVPVLLTR